MSDSVYVFGKGRTVSHDCFTLPLGAMKTSHRVLLGSLEPIILYIIGVGSRSTTDLFQLDQSPAQQHFPKSKNLLPPILNICRAKYSKPQLEKSRLKLTYTQSQSVHQLWIKMCWKVEHFVSFHLSNIQLQTHSHLFKKSWESVKIIHLMVLWI